MTQMEQEVAKLQFEVGALKTALAVLTCSIYGSPEQIKSLGDFCRVAEATSSAQDLRLPWNFFISAARKITGAEAASARAMTTTDLYSQPIEYLSALLFQWRSPSALSTGLGGTWLSANAASLPRPYAAWSPSVLSTILVGFFIPIFVLVMHFFFKWAAPDNISSSALTALVLDEIGASPLIFLMTVAPLMVFAIRWGNVLAAPGWLLHSPELFVPLLVRELSQLSVMFEPHDANVLSSTHTHTRAL